MIDPQQSPAHARAFLLAMTICALCAAGRTVSADLEWPVYGGTERFDRYSVADKINKRTISSVGIVWSRPSIDASLTNQFPDLAPSEYLRGTPIMVGGVLYAADAVGLVEAFDATSGKTIWVQQPFTATLKEAAGESSRGVAFWKAGADARIISVKGEYLYALDAKTGKPIATFGEGGRVSLNRHTPDGAAYFGFNGPLVVRDVIIVGGNGGGKSGGGYGDGTDIKESKPDDIRAYDARSGSLRWTFHVMPQPGDPARDTWGKGSADFVGNMTAWGPMSADAEIGYVYVPLTSPTSSFYGGHRPGANLYANSIVALDLQSGKLIWYFQTVHHDLWDYDNASAPAVGDIQVEGKKIKAVMQASKTGFLYVLDRATGKPVWPIEEKPVPQSDVPGEASSPTQPFPSKPPAFDRQGITEGDLIDFTPELHAAAAKYIRQFKTGPLFTPPSLMDNKPGGMRGTLGVPDAWGAGNWNTGAFDPETGIYYAASFSPPGQFGMLKPTAKDATVAYTFYIQRTADGGYVNDPAYGLSGNDLPLLKPPYGRITALDMNQGTTAWVVPNGDGPRNHPLLKKLNLPPLGDPVRPVALVTKTLLFVGESSTLIAGGAGVVGESKFRAYDKASGAVVWETTLPTGTTGGPITYEIKGRQFIVVPLGARGKGASWVALGIKN
jgi:glucose dehydrogenase